MPGKPNKIIQISDVRLECNQTKAKMSEIRTFGFRTFTVPQNQIFRQIFLSENERAGSELNVTQFVPHHVTQMRSSTFAMSHHNATSHGDIDDQPATKRRKVHLGFESSILEKLSKQEKIEENYFPWLQIIERILLKYSASILCSE